jgi:hypothetical protein
MNYLVLAIKNLKLKSFLYSLIPGFIIILIGILKYYFGIRLEVLISNFFDEIIGGKNLFILILLLLVYLAIRLNFSLIKKFFYNISTESFYSKNNEGAISGVINSISRNKFFALELLLILRNKRLRSLFIIPIYILTLYYLLFTLKQITDPEVLFFLHLSLTGIWGYSYGQYMFSWDSSYSDLIFASNFNIRRFIEVKFIYFLLSGFLLLLLAFPIMVSKNYNFLVLFTALFYNISIGFFIVLYTATFNGRRVELNRSMFFNLQGYSLIQFFSIPLAVLLPLLLLTLLSIYLSTTLSLLVINLICVLSLLNHKRWFNLIIKQLLKRKYINLEGYRK